ncbi:DUF6153 family protein [Streptomyces sp. LP05-1]|uniref:DUF6153 family protein n=1 Tax=Streptomyces pyxinae TaxID=2970734 RepID=A0ABT2CCC5_9ACTN|nr:DUF6153 family protein [Streptomyces sp. LP05-1]MCS0635066.1 DUF6153 family protein [Streptomyces sp. LP05-1]
MTSHRQRTARPPLGARGALLVLAVLAGLLGMHALAPGSLRITGAGPGTPAASAPAGVPVPGSAQGHGSAGPMAYGSEPAGRAHGAVRTADAPAGPAPGAHHGRPGQDRAQGQRPDHSQGQGHRAGQAQGTGAGGHGGGSHTGHADTACASGAVAWGVPLPALLESPGAPVAAGQPPPGRPASGPADARAPPSLAELQLLRI